MLMESLRNPRSSGYQVVATVMSRPPSWYKGKNYTDLDTALASLEKLKVHSIILTSLYSDPKVNEQILAAANENHCGFRFIPGQEDLLSGSTEVELFQGMPVVYVHSTPLNGWSRMAKRAFDIVFSALALVILSPVMLIIYLTLLLTGGNPIYKRSRLTRYGNSFNIYKFRSLKIEYSGMDPEAGFAKLGKPELAKKFRAQGDQLDDDPRISRLGNIIRPTSLDELPQFFNVLKGDVSIVGPRALIAEELNQYSKKNLILSTKSGLTGLAVISGRRDIPFEERRKLDLYYVQNWSFWLDIKIIFRTFIEVLTRRGTA
jgi:lipopolysaccharide/colanic/teichoic acid biosynthesis glycosyltransferase